jgi:hypothetical protein
MSGPSITSWNRLEPRPRSDSIERSLAAEVRDPLWFLTRQLQFGEFQGEDAASPAWIRFRAQFSNIDGWAPPGGAHRDYDKTAAPLEEVVETEPFDPDLATSVEIGQRFEAFLARAFEAARPGLPALGPAALTDLVQRFRTQYALPAQPNDLTDHEARRFLEVCAGRTIHGIALLAAQQLADLPVQPVVPAALADVVRRAVRDTRAWVQDVFGVVSTGDAPTWRASSLEYGAQVTATAPRGGRVTFDAHPGRDGTFDWYTFDEAASQAEGGGEVTQVTRSLLPIQVRFRGMPHARWWQMQDRVADLGEIQPELRELAKLVLMDFMFVHSNDWFVVPFTQDVGTLCRIESLVVHDVFGGRTAVERADKYSGDESARWSMFSTTAPSAPGGLGDYFILPPTASTTTLSSDVLESVKFIRDEMANMVWAIEHTAQDGIGLPWLGSERDRRGRRQEAIPAPPPGISLTYRIQTSVPLHWIPFMPVKISEAGEVTLQRTVMLGPPNPAGQRPAIRPVGRILAPPDPYRVREEEVPRTGTTVSRLVRCTRWTDGSTHLWIARQKRAGGGEGSSGLRFDIAHPAPAPP